MSDRVLVIIDDPFELASVGGALKLHGVKVVGDAIAMGFKLDRHSNLFRHLNPLSNNRDHPINRQWHDLANHIDKRRAKILGHYIKLDHGWGLLENKFQKAID